MKKTTLNVKDQNFPQYKFLEQIEGAEALSFAKKNNAYSDSRLKTDKRYSKTYKDILKIVSSKDKLPVFYIMNDEIYNFWQDNVHIKGILRKTSIKAFNLNKPKWITVLDIDSLAETEKENWVYKGINCFEPDNEICMISLSRGGKDAIVQREFNLKNKKFVINGFRVEESKSSITWLDRDTLLLSDATDPTTLTTSGYPSTIKVLKRGENITSAKTIYKCDSKSMSVGAGSQVIDNKRYTFITNQISFYEAEEYLLDTTDFKLTPIPIPKTADFNGFFHDMILFSTRDSLGAFPEGSLLSMNLSELKNKKPAFLPVFIPTSQQFFEYSGVSKNHLWVVTLNDVKKQVFKYKFENNRWIKSDISFADDNGNKSLTASNKNSHHVYFGYSDFLTPASVFYSDETKPKSKPKLVLTAPAFFKSKSFKISQYKVQSKDGTTVPYFIVYPAKMKLNTENPTLLYGYGGFEIPMTSTYSGTIGKIWLEKGGVYVLANIRGGGEYGPNWHRAALQKNRHKAYEDFYAIAEDLIKRKITSPRHLGIKGGSNGGLLTSVTFTQRPELFNAVISEVPLANMLEYHHWLAGASWMEEYGDPDDIKMREYILSYSPLHNLEKNKKYPEVFYLTSTKDDRVHPGHARQMVARMQELGHPVLYNENTDGGHGRASNMRDMAEFLALEFTYLYQKLF